MQKEVFALSTRISSDGVFQIKVFVARMQRNFTVILFSYFFPSLIHKLVLIYVGNRYIYLNT